MKAIIKDNRAYKDQSRKGAIEAIRVEPIAGAIDIGFSLPEDQISLT